MIHHDFVPVVFFSNTCTEVEILMFFFGPMATEYDSMQTEYCLQFLAIKNLDPLLAVPQRQMSDKFITKVTAKRFQNRLKSFDLQHPLT